MSPYVAHIRQTGRARWGMFRGSSTLLLRSARHYEPVVEVIAAAPPSAWDLDAHCYTTQAWPGIRQLDQQIRAAFGHPGGVSDTLATKVLPGVFGNVPAFDTFFRARFQRRRSAGREGLPQARRVLPRTRRHHRAQPDPHSGLPYRRANATPVQPRQGHRHDLLHRGRRLQPGDLTGRQLPAFGGQVIAC